MTLEEMAGYLKRYNNRKSMINNPHRYSATVQSIEQCRGVFGMDFEAIFAAPNDRKAAVFQAQEQRAQLLRSLMNGEEVDEAQFADVFGFELSALSALQKEQEPIRKALPRNLCILCFDDALKSHYSIALPLLERLHFDATFFITEMEASFRGPGFEDKSVYMDWSEIRALQDAGFELGNHSLSHIFGSQNMGRDFNIRQIRKMEEEFARYGLEKPVSYAYPSGISTPELVDCVRECGYLWARGNEEKEENGIRGMTYYDPHVDSPLAICNFGDPDFYTEDLLRKRILETPDDCIFGLTYHDVSDESWPSSCSFKRQMEILKELDMQVISVRALSEYIDPEKAYQYTLN